MLLRSMLLRRGTAAGRSRRAFSSLSCSSSSSSVVVSPPPPLVRKSRAWRLSSSVLHEKTSSPSFSFRREYSVLLLDNVDSVCEEAFQERGVDTERSSSENLNDEELVEKLKEHDGVVVRSATKLTPDVLSQVGERLRLIGRAGTGVDNIDMAAATRAGILVLNTPGGNTNAAAEMAFSLLMSLARQVRI